MQDFITILSVWEWAGVVGAIIYAVSYIFTSLDLLPSQSPHFYLVKLVAAVLVMTSLVDQYNLATLLIQAFFIVISVFGIMRHFSARRRRMAYERSLQGIGSPIASDDIRTEPLIRDLSTLANLPEAPFRHQQNSATRSRSRAGMSKAKS